jgi:hypothetical protein
MNDTDVRRVVEAVAGALREEARRSDAFRNALAALGRVLIDLADQAAAHPLDANAPAAATATAQDPNDTQDFPAPAPLAASPTGPGANAPPTDAGATGTGLDHTANGAAPPPPSTGKVHLKIGGPLVEVEAKGSPAELARADAAATPPEPADYTASASGEGPQAIDLELMARRCRLKARSCRHLITRRAAPIASGEERDALHHMHEMIRTARSMRDCFLWAFMPDKPQPSDTELQVIASCHEAVADAAELTHKVVAGTRASPAAPLPEAMALFAEASSALRVALQWSWLTVPDRDQSQAHAWLEQEAFTRRIFIERHMTLADPADPTAVGALRTRTAKLAGAVDALAREEHEVDRHVKKLRYHAQKIASNRAGDTSEDWQTVRSVLLKLRTARVSPGDPRLTAALAPVADGEPGDLATDSFLVECLARARPARDDDDVDDAPEPSRPWSENVAAVRAMLRGKRMVVIGGEHRTTAVERLRRAFDLDAVDWVELVEHGSGAPMRAPIARPDTAVVVVCIKLTGHLHAEEAQEAARAAGKPLVILKAGYNPEQIAHNIIAQASRKLTAPA